MDMLRTRPMGGRASADGRRAGLRDLRRRTAGPSSGRADHDTTRSSTSTGLQARYTIDKDAARAAAERRVICNAPGLTPGEPQDIARQWLPKQ